MGVLQPLCLMFNNHFLEKVLDILKFFIYNMIINNYCEVIFVSKKIQVTVPDEVFDWLSEEANKRGTRVSTLVTILIGDARKNQVNQANFQAMIDKFKALSSEQFSQMISAELEKEKRKKLD